MTTMSSFAGVEAVPPPGTNMIKGDDGGSLDMWPTALQSALYHSLDVTRSQTTTHEISSVVSSKYSTSTQSESAEPSSRPTSAEGRIPHDARQYKSRMCVYASTPDACPNGNHCFFAHGIEELRPIIHQQQQQQQQQQQNNIPHQVTPPLQQVSAPASAATNGLSTGSQQSSASSENYKAEYKTKPCRYSFSECPFAAIGRCQFAHSLEELRPSQVSRQNSAPLSTSLSARPEVPTTTWGSLPSSRPSGSSSTVASSLQQQQQQHHRQFAAGNNGEISFTAPTHSIQEHHSLKAAAPVSSLQQQQQQQQRLSGIPSASLQQQQPSSQPSSLQSNTSTSNSSSNSGSGNNSTHHARRFKTRLCKYHMAGHCPYAATNTCQFAHSEDELRSADRPQRRPSALDAWGAIHNTEAGLVGNTRFPTHTGGNTSLGARGLVAERSYPSTLVSPPSTTTNTNGISQHQHIASAGNSQQQQQQHHTSNQGTNATNNNGAALRAALEHKRFTKLCKYFLAGHCPFTASNTCQFAHSTAELRRRVPTSSSNADASLTSPGRRHSVDTMPNTHPSTLLGTGGQPVASYLTNNAGGIPHQSPVPTSSSNTMSSLTINTGKHANMPPQESLNNRLVSSVQHLDIQKETPVVVPQKSSPRIDPWQTDTFASGGQPDWSFRAEDASPLLRS